MSFGELFRTGNRKGGSAASPSSEEYRPVRRDGRQAVTQVLGNRVKNEKIGSSERGRRSAPGKSDLKNVSRRDLERKKR